MSYISCFKNSVPVINALVCGIPNAELRTVDAQERMFVNIQKPFLNGTITYVDVSEQENNVSKPHIFLCALQNGVTHILRRTRFMHLTASQISGNLAS